MIWAKYKNNQSIKTVKEHLNNSAQNIFCGTHIILLSTVQTWETTLLSSTLIICFGL